VLALKLEELIRAKAREKQIARDFHGNQYTGAICQKSDKDHIDTKKELARIAGVSHDTIAKVKFIENKATPEQKLKLITGKATVNQVYVRVRRQEVKERRQRRARLTSRQRNPEGPALKVG